MSENFLEPRYATRAPLPGTRGFKQFDKLDIVLTRDSNPLVTPDMMKDTFSSDHLQYVDHSNLVVNDSKSIYETSKQTLAEEKLYTLSGHNTTLHTHDYPVEAKSISALYLKEEQNPRGWPFNSQSNESAPDPKLPTPDGCVQ